MMARNLDNRVELVGPIDDPQARAEIQAILDLQLADTALAWELGADGRGGASPRPPGRSRSTRRTPSWSWPPARPGLV